MSEPAVIGAILNDAAAWDEAAAIIGADDFSDRVMRKLWLDVSTMIQAGEPVDVFSLHAKGYDPGMLGDMQVNTVATSVKSYALAVRREAQRRQAVAVLGDSHGRLLNGMPVADVLADTSASLEQIQDDRAGGYYDTQSATAAALQTIAEAVSARDNNGMAGVPCGLNSLNSISSGFRRKKLYVFAGRPGTGKTSLAMHCAFYAASKGYRSGIFELEMDAQELVARALSAKTGTPYYDITAGKVEALRAVQGATLPDGVFIDDAVRHVNQIIARAAEWKRKHDLSLLVVDHLGLIRGGDDKQSRARQLGEVSFELKAAAKRLDLPVLLLCQLNRNLEHERREPTLSDLRDSGEIEENADAVVLLHCRDKEKSMREVEVIVAKNRIGTVGKKGQPLTFDAAVQRWRA